MLGRISVVWKLC